MDIRWREPCCVLKMVTCQQGKKEIKKTVFCCDWSRIYHLWSWRVRVHWLEKDAEKSLDLPLTLLPAAEAQCKPYYSDYSRFRLLIHQMCTSHYLDLFITGVIGLNVITMAMEHYQQPKVLGQPGGADGEDMQSCAAMCCWAGLRPGLLSDVHLCQWSVAVLQLAPSSIQGFWYKDPIAPLPSS